MAADTFASVPLSSTSFGDGIAVFMSCAVFAMTWSHVSYCCRHCQVTSDDTRHCQVTSDVTRHCQVTSDVTGQIAIIENCVAKWNNCILKMPKYSSRSTALWQLTRQRTACRNFWNIYKGLNKKPHKFIFEVPNEIVASLWSCRAPNLCKKSKYCQNPVIKLRLFI